MATGATGQLGLALPVQGELSGTWGDTVNNGITQYTNIAIAGTLTLTGDGAVTLSNTTGDASASNIVSTLTGAGTVTAQFAIVRVTGTLTTAKIITGPSYSKTYLVVNAATGSTVSFIRSGQTPAISIAVGESALVYFNGTDYVKLVGTATAGAAGGSTTQVQYNSSGVLAGSANMTFDGTSMTLGGNPTLSAGTANGVTYLNGSKVLTSGSALWFDGTNFGVGTAGNTLNQQSVIYKIGANAVYQQIANGSTGLGATNGIRIGLTSAGVGEFYSPTAAISYIDGTEGMRLTSTGLGIGTSSPGSKLSVNGGSTQTVANFTSTSTAVYYALLNSGSQVFIGNDSTSGSFVVQTPASSYSTKLTLDNAGNLGLGVTPSTGWDTATPALQVKGRLALSGYLGNSYISNNLYNSSAGWKYLTANPAAYHRIGDNAFYWYQAPTGTIDTLATLTQAMTLNASGRLSVGSTSSSGRVYVDFDGGNNKYVDIVSSSGTIGLQAYGTYGTAHLRMTYPAVADWDLLVNSGGALTFVGTSERFRIASTGAFGLSGANYGTSGQVLTSGGSGAAPTWTTVSGGGSVAGSDTQVQYNNSGAFGASSVFTFNKSSTDPQLNLNGTTSSAVQLRATSATGGPYVGLNLNNSGAAVFWTWDTAAVPLRFVAGGTEVARFRIASGLPDSFQLVNGLSVGNATPASTGAGITFPATQSASSDANTLDDYEEGSWTPVSSFSGGNGTRTDTVTGKYTKIGDMVYANFDIVITKGTASGNLSVTGLPFARGGQDNRGGGVMFVYISMATLTNGLIAYIGDSQSSFTFFNGPALSNVTAAGNLGTSSQFIGTVIYKV